VKEQEAEIREALHAGFLIQLLFDPNYGVQIVGRI
jgi:hypothetical protein